MRINWRDAALAVLTIWWRLFKPHTVGVRGLVLNDVGELLLVRHSYGRRDWFLPGGGHRGAESPEVAIVREMREETGLEVEVFKLIGVYFYAGAYKRDHVYLFQCQMVGGQVRLVGGEIAEIGWFAPDALPEPLMPGLERILHDWRSGVAGFGTIDW
jgi:8-oxo-dGTP pyrophosphatase MutT (NUDIX family)